MTRPKERLKRLVSVPGTDQKGELDGSLYGRVGREGNYWYAQLPAEWQEKKGELVEISASAFHKYEQEAKERFRAEVKKPASFRWMTPRSPIGLHISLTPPKAQEQKLRFTIPEPDILSAFPKEGHLAPSGFDPHVYPLIWVVWNVSVQRPYKCHECHISVAIYAAVVGEKPSTRLIF